jgi:hypothetical protein
MIKPTALLSLSLFAVTCFTACATSNVTPRQFTGREVAAISVATAAFKATTHGIPDLRHYTVEIAPRGRELEVTFIADPDPPPHPPNWAGTGGGSVYGQDIRFVVSLSTLKVVRFNFFR